MTSKPPMDDVALNQTYAHLVARVLVRPLLGTAVRPNHITWLRIATGAASCLLLAEGHAAALLWSGVLWVISGVLDRADGELARMGDMRSEAGARLDYLSDMILDSAWFLAAGIGLRHTPLGGWAIALGVWTCAVLWFCNYVSELYEQITGPGTKVWYGLRRFHPDDALFLLAPVVWVGPCLIGPALVAAGVVTPIVTAVTAARYYGLRRRTRAASRELAASGF